MIFAKALKQARNLKELLAGRTEELAWKAKKLPEELLSRHGVKEKHQPLYQKLVLNV